MAAEKKVPQEYRLLEGFRDAGWFRTFGKGVVSRPVTGRTGFTFRPIESVSFEHSRDHERQVRASQLQFGRPKHFEQGSHEMLCGVIRREHGIARRDLPGSGMQGGNEGQEEHVACEALGSVCVPCVEKFEEDGIGGMGSVASAAAGAKMRGERQDGWKCGQLGTRIGEFLIFMPGAVSIQLFFQMRFELAKKTTASGSSFHDRPPGKRATERPRYDRLWLIQRIKLSAHWGCPAGSGDESGSGTKSMAKKVWPHLRECVEPERRDKPGNTARH
jgi:hypothetical protein